MISDQFSFQINDCNTDGWARVEYIHPTLGRYGKQVFIPLNLSPEVQLGAIIIAFPVQVFHSRLLAQIGNLKPAIEKGTFTYSLEAPHDDPIGCEQPTIKV